MQLAVALYNNHVDDDDELEFHKGDILTVLIENPNGFDGWWLCKYKDKCGLCPENRLQLIQNTDSPQIKSFSRVSTISMYDRLSNHYDRPRSQHENDNSDFLSNFKPPQSSSETSSCSSGIYSANDPHFSSSSSEFCTNGMKNNKFLSTLDLKTSFEKLSIQSLLIDKYHQLISKPNIESIVQSFLTECHLFLNNYGYLLDRSTYRLIKENFLNNKKEILQISTKILQLITLKLKEKSENYSYISYDMFNKLHLEPIQEIPNEKLTTSLSTTEIYKNIHQKNHRLNMKHSKTCHSNFLTEFNNDSINPLIKCYYRHINEQVNLILKCYLNLLKNEKNVSLLINESKGLVVAGHKLLFILETLRQHLKQIQTSLMYLTRQLHEALKKFIELLKKFHQENLVLIIQFKENFNIIMNIVKKIKQQCI